MRLPEGFRRQLRAFADPTRGRGCARGAPAAPRRADRRDSLLDAKRQPRRVVLRLAIDVRQELPQLALEQEGGEGGEVGGAVSHAAGS